jgi:peptide deformylase
MALLTIRLVPDPVLRRRARPIKVVDDSVRKLARDMIETMQDAHGVGLAANQVGVLKRLVVLQMPEEEPRIMVNPEITRREGERQVDEGCLSVPGYVGLVTRSVTVRARALDEWGAKLRISAELLLAQAIEHEVDHLNGILYLDHLVAHEQLRKVEKPAGEDDNGEAALHPAPVDPLTPHMHDVTYEVHVEHGDGKVTEDGPSADHGAPELLVAKARISGLTSDASVLDLAFDLATPANGGRVGGAQARPRRRVAGRPGRDGGGVIIERADRLSGPRGS